MCVAIPLQSTQKIPSLWSKRACVFPAVPTSPSLHGTPAPCKPLLRFESVWYPTVVTSFLHNNRHKNSAEHSDDYAQENCIHFLHKAPWSYTRGTPHSRPLRRTPVPV